MSLILNVSVFQLSDPLNQLYIRTSGYVLYIVLFNSRILGTSSPNYPLSDSPSLTHLSWLYDHLTEGIVCCCFALIPTVTTRQIRDTRRARIRGSSAEGNEPTRWQGTEHPTYTQYSQQKYQLQTKL